MRAPPLTMSRPDRCAAGIASPRAGGRDARYGGRGGRRGSGAGPAAARASPRPARRDAARHNRRGKADVGADAALGRARVAISSISNNSGTKRHIQSSPSLHPPPALLGAVAEPDHPFGAQLGVIGDFLDRLGGDRGDRSSFEPARWSNSIFCQVENRNCRAMVCAKSPLGCSTSQQLRKSSTSRWKASASPSRPLPFDLAGMVQEMGRLADQVEAHIGEAEIDLDRGRMAAPFAEPLAEDQAVVAEAQQSSKRTERCTSSAGASNAPAPVAPSRQVDGRQRRHQMCFTPSGMS